MKRVNITISDYLNDKVGEYAELYGVAKSAIMNIAIGQYITNLEASKKFLEDGSLKEALVKFAGENYLEEKKKKL